MVASLQDRPSPLTKPMPLSLHRSTSSDASNDEVASSKSSLSQMDIGARLANTPPHVLIRSISSLSQQSLRPRTPDSEGNDTVGGVPAIRKGVLLQARDRLFSRWKERYFVLTKDYLACFRKGTTKYSEMGSFIFKVNLATVIAVSWEERRGSSILALSLPREGKMLLRAKTGLDQWYRDLRETTNTSRNRRHALKRGASTTHLNFLSESSCQLSPVPKGSRPQFSLSDSTPEIVQLCESVCREGSPRLQLDSSKVLDRSNRFSLCRNSEAGCLDSDTASSSVASNKLPCSASGSVGSTSLASTPSMKSAWPLPSMSPLRLQSSKEAGPRSRLSLYEGVFRDGSGPSLPKDRHSVCVAPDGLHSDLNHVRRPLIPDVPRVSRPSPLQLQSRNPVLDLLDGLTPPSSRGPGSSHVPKDRDRESPLVSHSSDMMNGLNDSSVDQRHVNSPRSRANLALFRHSNLYN